VRLSHRITFVVALTAFFAIAVTLLGAHFAQRWSAPPIVIAAAAIMLTLPVVLWCAYVISARIGDLHDSLGNALRAARDGDYGLRLAPRGDREIAELKRLYNELVDVVRAGRHEIHHKEVMLDTILQRTPIALVLVNPADRVVYSNAIARELFAAGARLDGRHFAEILDHVAPPLRDALAAGDDTMFSVDEETFHVTQRVFRLNTQQHRLILLERLTPELRRQEVAVWKKAIRVINHEINNTVAPISSLFHSAKLVQKMPDRQEKLPEIYETIDERLAYLRQFLESYAQFARLPAPRREPARWNELLADVHALYDFRAEVDPRAEANIDRAQLQQVLINLVKNAHESGSDPSQITIGILRVADGVVVRVADAGRGMSEDVLRQALVPFFSTKPGGTGVGLAVSNEIIEAHGGRMCIEAREGGGTVVTCFIPQ
jgi:two-component system, NtrC family, nitrogen regulation sensor histidine kinase NtrY